VYKKVLLIFKVYEIHQLANVFIWKDKFLFHRQVDVLQYKSVKYYCLFHNWWNVHSKQLVGYLGDFLDLLIDPWFLFISQID